MKSITIELDETVYDWLNRISQVTGKSVEVLARGAIGNVIIALEDQIHASFSEESA